MEGSFPFLLLAVLTGAFGSAAAEPRTAPGVSEVAPEIVATVNGKELTRDQLAALAIGLYGRQALETLIAQEVVRQEAARRGLRVTAEEVEAYTKKRVQEQLDNMARRTGAGNADALEALRRDAEAALRPFVGPELLARKLMSQNIQITEEDLRAEFERRHGPKVKVLQIVVRTRAEAEDAIKKLKMGADFAQLAQDISIDRVSRRSGGAIPPLARNSTLGEAAFGLKPGEISEPVQTPDGFHVLKLIETLPASGATFESVQTALREELLDRMMTERREKWLDDLISRAEIKRLLLRQEE